MVCPRELRDGHPKHQWKDQKGLNCKCAADIAKEDAIDPRQISNRDVGLTRYPRAHRLIDANLGPRVEKISLTAISLIGV
jgi:hypothetical protein